MQENEKRIVVKKTARRAFRTEAIWQYDVGHVLAFEGFDLPETFQVHFSRSMMGEAVTMIGSGGECVVPDMYAQTAAPIYAWLYIAEDDTGLTTYLVEIPVQRRAQITDQEPTPVEQSAFDQAISALNDGVTRAEAAQAAAEGAQAGAEGYAETAADSAITAGNAARAAAASETAAAGSASAAATSAQDALASREGADQSATAAGVSERAAKASETAAAGSASAAAGSASAAGGSASQAAGYASTATDNARAAAGSATAADTSARAAAGSAADSQQSAQAAAAIAQGAAASAAAADGSATEAAGSATAAAESASAAAGSASTASQSATEAAQSAAAAAQSAQALTNLIDDTAGVGDTTKVWSADKSATERNSLMSAFTEHEQYAEETYAKQDGTYEDLTAGNALEVLSDRGTSDTEPYMFRKALGWNRAKLNAVVGGTVVWNQLAKYINDFTKNGVTFSVDGNIMTVNGTAEKNFIQTDYDSVFQTMKIPEKHVVCFIGFDGKSKIGLRYIGRGYKGSFYSVSGNAIQKPGYGIAKFSFIISEGTTFDNETFTLPIVIDLTILFGSTIADYIYSVEQATPGAGVALFRSWFPNDYYEYNPGELISVSGLQSRETVGFNAWDEEWQLGDIGAQDGATLSGQYIISKNMIPVLPVENYYFNRGTNNVWLYFYDADKNYFKVSPAGYRYLPSGVNVFTVPDNARYVRFVINQTYGNTYNHDICINLSDTSRNGTYKPYVKHSYPLDYSLALRGVPKLVDNKLAFDGDRYLPDGTVERRYGVIDLGSFNWARAQLGSSGFYFFYSGMYVMENKPKYLASGLTSNGYTVSVSGAGAAWNYEDRTLVIGNSSTYQVAYIRDDSFTDTSAFKAAMSGVYLIYELASPTTETAEPYRNLQIQEKGGTEAFVSNAELSVPVEHETFYPINIFDYIDQAIAAALNS